MSSHPSPVILLVPVPKPHAVADVLLEEILLLFDLLPSCPCGPLGALCALLRLLLEHLLKELRRGRGGIS